MAGNAVIDLVLVILDGISRDLGISYEFINQGVSVVIEHVSCVQ